MTTQVGSLPTITRQDVIDLRAEAGEAGDLAQVAICERALDGSHRAWRECRRVIRNGRAQHGREV